MNNRHDRLLSPRVARLREAALQPKALNEWIEVERIRARAAKRAVDWSAMRRQADLFRSVLAELPIRIEPDELIVGSQDCCFAKTYDLYADGVEHSLAEQAPADVRAYWTADPYNVELGKLLTAEQAAAQKENVCIGKRVSAHAIPDFGMVLRHGLHHVIERARQGLPQPADDRKRLHDPDDFYRAVIESCASVIHFAERFASLADRLAEKETNPVRAEELRTIAVICRQVPAQPARTFREALQSFWFCYLAMTIEQSPNAYAFSVGRLDQWVWPFLKADLSAGRITNDEALELIECLWLKFVVGPECWAVSQNIMIGGVTAEGDDACNPLTLLCLEATRRLRTAQPSVAVRIAPESSPRLLEKAVEVLVCGMGIPAIHNDATVIPTMRSIGYTEADARNYCIAGCQEFVAEGADNSRTTAGKFNLLKCLELALNDGVSTLSGKRLGPATGKPEAFGCYDDIWKAFRAQVTYFVDLMVDAHNRADLLIAAEKPVPFLSGMMGDCLDKGIDFRSDGARYNFSGCLVHGLGSTADALAAMRTLVFERRVVDIAELADALRTDFVGQELLRQSLLNSAPKYGNGEPEVDRIAAEVFRFTAETIQSRRNAWGGLWRAGFNTPSTHVHYGRTTGATPDGRHAGIPMSYGTGPTDGRAKQGPTAVARSVTSFNHKLATLGTDLTFSFHPTVVNGAGGRDRLAAFVRSLLDLGAHHFQINIVGAEELRAAQDRPEEYADLLVRVHGYSTRFVALERSIQDDLIARLESFG